VLTPIVPVQRLGRQVGRDRGQSFCFGLHGELGQRTQGVARPDRPVGVRMLFGDGG
jgi:hypothetical protein